MNIKTSGKLAQLENITTAAKQVSLRQTVMEKLDRYYMQLEPSVTTNVYNLVLPSVEQPLLRETMQLLHDNQSHAAIVLGLSRGTLRKLLKNYGMDTAAKASNPGHVIASTKQNKFH